MSVPIQPVADYIVAQAEIAESKTASGLYLPDAAKEKPKVAKVLAVGKDVKDIKVSDRIIYESYAETSIKHDGKDYLVVKAEKVIAKVV